MNNTFIKTISDFSSLLFLIISLSPAYLFSQFKQAGFDQITIDNGLSQGTVTSIIQDNKGFMWFGTHDGLNRFDGYNFKIFKHDDADPKSICNNWIEAIDMDINGDLWIATSEGFAKYDKFNESFVQYQITLPNNINKFELNNIQSIYCDKYYKQNIIWLGTGYGLIRFDVDKKVFEFLDLTMYGCLNNSIKSFAQTKSGDLFIGSGDKLLLKLGRKNNSIKCYQINLTPGQLFKRVSINRILIDDKDNIIVVANCGIYYYNSQTDSFDKVKTVSNVDLSNSRFMSACADNEKIFIGMDTGIAEFDKNLKTISVYSNDRDYPYSISRGSVISLFKDKSSQIWIGTNGSGLNILSPFKNNFNKYSIIQKNLPEKSIRAFCEDKNGGIWVGGYGGLSKLDVKANRFVNYEINSFAGSGGNGPKVFSLCIDKENPDKYIWVGTEGGGLLKFDLLAGKFEQIPFLETKNNSVNGAIITALYDDGIGSLWIGSENGLNVYDKKSRTFKYFIHDPNDSTSISPKMVNCIIKDSFGKMWIGTNYGGLNLFEVNKNTFEHFTHNSADSLGISSNNVKVLFEDSHNNLWIGTHGGGLNKFDRDKKIFKKYSFKNCLVNDVIYGILGDNENNLWLSTNSGLCKFNYKTNDLRNYNVLDGLQSNEFNTNAYFKSSLGEMFFGGIRGFNSFYPGKIIENKTVPPVVITNFFLFNEKTKIGQKVNSDIILQKSPAQTDTIYLSHDNNIFSFEFAALDFTSPSKNKYKYMLEGFDSKWNYAGTNRMANYTNIDPGTYIFKVIGSNNDGVWNQKGDSIVVIISPPYWSSWWFKFFGVIVFGFVMYGLYEFRLIAEKERSEVLEKEVEQRTDELKIANDMLKRDALTLEETNESKDKLFSIISHDLKNPFQSLLGYTEWLLEDYNTFNDEEKRKMINNICESSVNIYNLLVRLLEWSRLQTSRVNYEPVKIDLKNLVDSIIKLLHVTLERKAITVVNEIDYNINVFADENMLISIFQNLITNAVKFSFENSIVIISTITNDDFVAISVTDSGVGIPEKMIDKLFKTSSIHSTKGTNNEQGTGFGLLLCRELIEKNGGTIWVESEVGKGSKFKFTLPRPIEIN